VSRTLREARRLIASLGWAPRALRQTTAGSLSRGPLDVLTAVRIAAGGSALALLGVVDWYALLAPIASVIPSSFAAWEVQPQLDTAAVLSMFDRAIAFATQAETTPDLELLPTLLFPGAPN
jgi:hypothetical protein